MTKLQAYNHVLFAVLGTGAACLILLGALLFVVRLLSIPDAGHRVLSDEKVKALAKQNRRKQVLAFGEPILIDSSNNHYVIPVSQKQLTKEETIGVGYGGRPELSRARRGFSSEYSYRGYGALNNLIIYEPATGTTAPVFDTRISINGWDAHRLDSVLYLFMFCTTEDTDRDGTFSGDDIEELFVYSFRTGNLRNLRLPSHSIVDAVIEKGTNKVILSIGFDKDGDGRYEHATEPTGLKKCNVDLTGVTDVVDEQVLRELQKLLEGSDTGAG
jgi:hypothetical protein